MSNQFLEKNYLKGVELNTIPGTSVSLLIGADVPEMFCLKSFRKGPQGTPVANETSIGWLLLGPSLSWSDEANHQVNFVSKFDDEVEQLVSNLCDAIFRTDTSVLSTQQSSEDRNAHENLKSSIGITSEGHYRLPLLWKNQDKRLPNNITMTKHRLYFLERRFLKDSALKEKHFEVISAYLKGQGTQL